MSDTSCDRLITVTDYITEYRNMYIYEGAFGRINPYISYGKKHPMPVINPGNLMADINFFRSRLYFYVQGLFVQFGSDLRQVKFKFNSNKFYLKSARHKQYNISSQ